jgi:hypothetical protein
LGSLPRWRYVASASAIDNVDRMIDLAFNRAERGDRVVTFAGTARCAGAV